MSRWSFEHDLFLAKYFDGVGDLCGTHDLGRPAGSATKRVQKLKATGAWFELKKLLAADWEFRRNYHIALGQIRAVENIDMMHPGAPDELGEEHGYFPASSA